MMAWSASQIFSLSTLKHMNGPKCLHLELHPPHVISIPAVFTVTGSIFTGDIRGTIDWPICMRMTSKQTIGPKSTVTQATLQVGGLRSWHKSMKIVRLITINMPTFRLSDKSHWFRFQPFTFSEDIMGQQFSMTFTDSN